MTAIAAISHRGKVYIAGDSCISSEEGTRSYMLAPKVWLAANNRIAVGGSGDVACFEALRAVAWEASEKWLRTRARAALIQQCEALGCATSALIGFSGQLWVFDHEYSKEADRWTGSLFQLDEPYAAAGSAELIVAGFLAASKLPPAKRVLAAVKEAARRCDGVGGKISVVSC